MDKEVLEAQTAHQADIIVILSEKTARKAYQK